MHRNHKALLASVFAATLMLGGCATGPTAYEIKTSGDPVINRDVSGKPLSVVVRLYQLKDATEFSKLTFATATSGRSDAELLGQDFIERTEIVVVPGAQKVNSGTVLPEAKYVGIVGYFRNPDRHAWRYLVKADDVRHSGLNFTVRDCYLELSGTKPVVMPSQPENSKPECTAPEAAPAAAKQNNSATPAAKAAANKAKRAAAKAIPTPAVKAVPLQ